MRKMTDHFMYKREVNKSVLHDGFGIDREYLSVFLEGFGVLKRGESKDVSFVFNGISYPVTIKNLNNPQDKRKNDSYQVRYPLDGEFARNLQGTFQRTYAYIQEFQALSEKQGKRPRVIIPKEYKEYLAIYTTDAPGVFACEAILADDMQVLRNVAKNQSERIFEAEFNYDVTDDTAGLNEKTTIVRIRRLNRKIGESLKELYGYRCQICGQMIGERYGSYLVEAHHIDYFVKSLNNDMSNQLIVCPNHHGIIHDRNPKFNRKKLTYLYPNGLEEGLKLNKHL